MRKLFSALLLLAALHGWSQTADDIINKHFEATGGRDKWAKVTTIHEQGQYVMGPGMLAPVNEWRIAKPYKSYYSDFSWQGMTNKQFMQADTGWSYNPFSGKRETDPLTPEDIRGINLTCDPQGLLFNYKEKGYTVEYLGMDDMDGADVHKLRLTTKQGDMVYYLIDAQSFYVLKISTRIKFADKEEKRYTVFSDFRKTEYGIVMPFSAQQVDENGTEQGGPVTITKVEVNAVADAKTFEKPASK